MFHRSHLVLVLSAALLAVGLAGAYAAFAKNPTGRNPYTAKCPGNAVLYGATTEGRYNTTKDRERVFGRAGKHQRRTTFMGKRVTVHKKVKPCLKAVEWDLKRSGTKYKVKHIWGYARVNSSNPRRYFHPYGGAVDINPPTNPRCRGGCSHDIPKRWVQIFENHGFYWGGNYPRTKDYMHFEWHGQKP